MSPKLNLYIHVPEPIFKARVNMSTVTYPVSEITYDGVTLGAFADIQFDATLVLGTTEGSDDLGRVRVTKPADADTIFIARSGKGYEDGTLVIQDNAYITIWDDYRVWAKIPYFQSDEDVTIVDYKDGDIAVGDYNDEIPPLSNCGPGTADYIVQGPDTLTVQFPRDGVDVSFPMADGATITTYNWDVADGTITVGTSASAVITATFPPGFRWVALTVTDSNGKSHTSRCPVLAIDGGATPEVPDPTFKAFRIKQSFARKGQTLDLEIFDELDRASYPDGTLVMFWWDSAADPGDRNHMRFIGWLDSESNSVSRGRTGIQKSTSLRAIDVAGRLSILPGFPQALTRDEEAEQWSLMPTLDMQKALYYLLFWHSTALNVADFTLPTLLSTYDSMRLDSGAASLFDQVDQQAQKVVPDHYLTCNAQGQMNVRRDWRLDDVADRRDVDDTVTIQEWNELTWEYNRHPKVHVLRSGAILASTDWVDVEGEETLPLAFSIAPSDSSAFSQGTTEMTQNEGLALTQEDLNKSEGHRFAMVNSRFGNFSWKDPTGVGFYLWEPALMNRIALELSSLTSAYRGLPFSSAMGMTETMNVDYARNKYGTTIKASVTWKKEEEGFPALTYDPEGNVTTPVEEEIGVVPPSPSFGLTVGADLVVGVGCVPYLSRTSDFTDATPTWDVIYIDFSIETEPSSFDSFVVDPFSPGYIAGSGAINGFAVSRLAVWKINDMFAATPTATKICTFNTANMGSVSCHNRSIAASFGEFQVDAEDNPWLMVTGVFDAAGVGVNANDGVWEIHSTDGGQTWSTEQKVTAFANSAGARDLQQEPIIWLSSRTPGKGILFAQDSNTTTFGYVTIDWGVTWTKMTDPLVENDTGYGGGIHVPWDDNEDESIVYHGHYTHGTQLWKLKRVTNTTIDDVTPTYLSDGYGPMYGLFSVRAYDSNRQYMLMGGVTNADGLGTVQDQSALFVSSDAGDTWTLVLHSTDTDDFLDGECWQAAFTASDPNSFYVWGPSPWSDVFPAVGYSDDLGATVQDKGGNLPALAVIDSNVNGFIAIAGGPDVVTPPPVGAPLFILWEETDGTIIGPTLSASKTCSAVASGGSVTRHVYITVCPQTNTKRMVVRCDWQCLRSKTGGILNGSPSLGSGHNSGLITRTGTHDYSPPGINGTTSGSWEYEFNYPGYAGGDWPVNSTSILSGMPTDVNTPEGIHYDATCVSQASGGHTVVTTINMVITVVEIELDDGTTYTF